MVTSFISRFFGVSLVVLMASASAKADAVINCKGTTKEDAEVRVVYKDGVLSSYEEGQKKFEMSAYILSVGGPSGEPNFGGGFAVLARSINNGNIRAVLNVRTDIEPGTNDLHKGDMSFQGSWWSKAKIYQLLCQYSGI